MATELERRVAATEATKARFEGKPFDWRGSATCIHLVRFHAAQMGHKVPIVPRFRSALGAKKALLATGCESLPDYMDKHFPRIAPAQMLVGDVAAFPGEGGMDALYVYGQLRAFLGWHEDAPDCQVVRVSDEGYRLCVGAWRL